MSDAEVAQLVPAALDDALTALTNRDPVTFLHLRACEAREAMRKMAPALKGKRANAESVARAYRKAVAFQDIEHDLALKLVSSIRRYDRLSRARTREGPTEPHEI